MSGFDQITGHLDNGGSYRVSRYTLELYDPTGVLLETYDMAEFTAVRRDGRVVTLERRQGQPVTVVAASIDDAGRLGDMVQSALPPPPVPAAPAPITADQRVDVRTPGSSQSGWMVAIVGLVLVAIILGGIYLAVDQGWFDADDSPTATPGAVATATPEPTQPEAPTATPVPEASPTPEPTPTPSEEEATPTP
jgi:hypothetical protein